jgi:cell division protein FtsB
MRSLWLVLIFALLALQYKFWLGDGNIHQWLQLEKKNSAQQDLNEKLRARNEHLTAEIDDLKSGHQSLEEKARGDLGMVKTNETYYQLVE